MIKRFFPILLTLSLVLMTVSTALAAQPEAAGPGVVVKYATKAETQQSLKLWTPERMQSTKGMVITADQAEALPAEEMVEQGVSADVVEFAASAPDPKADQQAQQAFPQAWKQIQAAQTDTLPPVEPLGTPGVYIRYPGAMVRSNFWQTFRTVGRLYYRLPNGVTSYCVATVISTRNIVIAPASCIFDTVANRFYTNFQFVPAYSNGFAPYGTFNYTTAYVLTLFAAGATPGAVSRYDVGLVRLANNASARPVTYYTGTQAMSLGYPYVHMDTIVSYYVGELALTVCHSETFSAGTDLLGYGCTPYYLGSPLFNYYYPVTLAGRNRLTALNLTNTLVAPIHGHAVRLSSTNIGALCTSVGC